MLFEPYVRFFLSRNFLIIALLIKRHSKESYPMWKDESYNQFVLFTFLWLLETILKM